jgi:hypothetical protein
LAVDAGVAAYDGYKVGTGISDVANDIKNGDWTKAGSDCVNTATSFNSATGAVKDMSDGTADNGFNCK